MQKIIICFLLFSLAALVFSDSGNPADSYELIERASAVPLSLTRGIGSIAFETDRFILTLDSRTQAFPYSIMTRSGLTYIHYGLKRDHSWLLLYSPNYILVYGENGKLLHQGLRMFTPEDSFQLVELAYFTTSSLTENGTHYSSENLGMYAETDKPWANAGGRPAVNEIITLTASHDFNKLIISNGFISFRKPELFLINSRVKTVSIFDVDSNKKLLDAQLEDTSVLQEINLGTEVRRVSITITDVYPGTRYKDTCINFILAEYRDPTPYLGPQGGDVIQ